MQQLKRKMETRQGVKFSHAVPFAPVVDWLLAVEKEPSGLHVPVGLDRLRRYIKSQVERAHRNRQASALFATKLTDLGLPRRMKVKWSALVPGRNPLHGPARTETMRGGGRVP